MAAAPSYEEDTRAMIRLQSTLLELKKTKVRVGYQPPEGRERYESGITVAKLAAVMEFGGGDIPARSFIRSTIHEKQLVIAAEQEKQIGRALSFELDVTEAMSNVGSFVLKLIRAKLDTAAAWAAPNDPETIERKGGRTPLSETKLLSRALSWRVSIGSFELARGNS